MVRNLLVLKAEAKPVQICMSAYVCLFSWPYTTHSFSYSPNIRQDRLFTCEHMGISWKSKKKKGAYMRSSLFFSLSLSLYLSLSPHTHTHMYIYMSVCVCVCVCVCMCSSALASEKKKVRARHFKLHFNKMYWIAYFGWYTNVFEYIHTYIHE